MTTRYDLELSRKLEPYFNHRDQLNIHGGLKRKHDRLPQPYIVIQIEGQDVYDYLDAMEQFGDHAPNDLSIGAAVCYAGYNNGQVELPISYIIDETGFYIETIEAPEITDNVDLTPKTGAGLVNSIWALYERVGD